MRAADLSGVTGGVRSRATFRRKVVVLCGLSQQSPSYFGIVPARRTQHQASAARTRPRLFRGPTDVGGSRSVSPGLTVRRPVVVRKSSAGGDAGGWPRRSGHARSDRAEWGAPDPGVTGVAATRARAAASARTR